MIVPCENCGETDEHSCWIDGIEYGPYDDGKVFVPGVGWRGTGYIPDDDMPA